MTKVVLSFVKKFKASWIFFSVSESKDEVASSKRIILLFFRNALAIDNLCFSPPESLIPFSPIRVLYLFGSKFMNSSEKDNFAASFISWSDAFKLAYFMLFKIVSSNNVVSWLTKETFFLKDESFLCLIDWSSIFISPFVHS